jgi:hypothetical protein
MKASELIKALQAQIDKHGDLEVTIPREISAWDWSGREPGPIKNVSKMDNSNAIDNSTGIAPEIFIIY